MGDDYDIVHIDEEPYSAVTAQIARVCARRGLPFVFFAWQNIDKRIPPPFSRMRGYVFERASGGIAGTAEAAAVLRAWGFDRPIAIIPQMGIDPARFRPDPDARRRIRDQIGAGAADFVIGFGGRLVPEKGVQSLIRAVSRLSGTRLVILGDGPARGSIEAEATRCRVADRVVLRTDVPYASMPEWLNALDALALPSVRTRTWKEQFGRVLVEAMACGIAVIGSSSGEIPNVIGEAGLIFPEGDEAELVAALEQLRASPSLRARLAEAGRRRATELFSNRRIVKDTMAFYESLLAGVAA